MADDVKNNSESSPEDEAKLKDESLKASEADTETSEEDESGKPSKAQRRIQQLVAERDEAREIALHFRKLAVDPNDAAEFKKWKDTQIAKAEKAEEEGKITPQRLKEIRAVMRQADPEYAQFIERQKVEQEERMEAQFDDAEDEIRDLAKTIGIAAKDEKAIARLARQVMLEIDSTPRLKRMWAAGNLKCVSKAFEALDKEFISPIRKSVPMQARLAEEKRRVKGLPTLPSASGSLTQAEQRKPEDRGLTKNAGEEAWRVFQGALQE